jgi:hypothetical protein
MRFLIDPGGLLSLIDGLTTRYSTARAREALFEFERLMRVELATPGRPPYAALDLPGWLGKDYYWNRLDEFISSLVEVEYLGRSWDTMSLNEGWLVERARGLRDLKGKILDQNYKPPFSLPRDTLKEARYFSNRGHLISLASEFVDDLFLNAARSTGKETWCEKTPQHLLHLDFIWELFPESVVLHIKRDPRGVVHSLTKQRWSPNDVKSACLYIKGTYDRWFDLCSLTSSGSKKYFELKLEDFAASPQPWIEIIADFCGLDNCFENIPEISPDKVNYWREEMTREDIRIVNELLGEHIEKLGYQI